MAIKKGSHMLAADVHAKNLTYQTADLSGQPDYTIGNDSYTWNFDVYTSRNLSSVRNVVVDLRGSDQYEIRFYTDASHSTYMWNMYGDETDPHLNTTDWTWTKEDDGKVTVINIPDSRRIYFDIDYVDKFLQRGPGRWYCDIYGAQTPINTGDKIRLWDTNRHTLLPEGTARLYASDANSGRFGSE